MRAIILLTTILSTQLLLAQAGLICDSVGKDGKEISVRFPGKTMEELRESTSDDQMYYRNSYQWMAYHIDALLCESLEGPLKSFAVMQSDLDGELVVAQLDAPNGSKIVLQSILPGADLEGRAYIKYAVDNDKGFGIAKCELSKYEEIVFMTQEKFTKDDKRAYRCSSYFEGRNSSY